jgi:CheY-like chemotaxis protein
MRVLIADDQRDVGRSLADLVRCCNHDIVAVVGSGLEAIQAYTRYHPDLVLMDYRMPKFNGATACRNILSKDPLARIILVTGWSPSDEAGASGAIAILPKPVDLERLNATLQSVAQMLPVPSPVGSLGDFQPNASAAPICDQVADFNFLPSSSSELPSSTFDLPPLSSELPPPIFHFVLPSLEIISPSDVPQNQFEQTVEPSVLVEEKIPVKRRSNRRPAQRARAQ